MNSKSPNSLIKRFPIIDQIRGMAIVLMVFFHLFYDLNLFHYVDINFSTSSFWWGLPRVIVFLFLLSMGLSLPLVHYPKIKWKKMLRRTGKIGGLALIVSLVTYLLFPKHWIYFGTLHCIAVVGPMALPLLKYPYIALISGLALITPSVLFNLNIPWFVLPHQSMDYIAPFPWVGVVWLGFFAFHKKFHHFSLPQVKIFNFLGFLGKHSLLIYMAHQAILYALVYLFHTFQLWLRQ